MLFKVLPKTEFLKIVDHLGQARPVIGPVRKGTSRDGRALYDFERLAAPEHLSLEATTTIHSAKRFFLPHRETLCRFKLEGRGFEKLAGDDHPVSQVVVGLHPCDINALNRLDKVLSAPPYPDHRYLARRRSSFLIGLGCMPEPHCFCRSMGTHSAWHGFDLFLTDLGEEYFAEILSAAAFELLQGFQCREAAHADHEKYKAAAAAREKRFTARVETTDLAKILDMEFESPAWEEWGKKCFSCGSCASACPTCYCYGVREEISLDFASAVKEKILYSCNLVDFAEVAGGHNFRKDPATRLKYRYYHKHRGFLERFEEPLCVGCGRCGLVCLAGITVPRVIASVRGREEGHA